MEKSKIKRFEVSWCNGETGSSFNTQWREAAGVWDLIDNNKLGELKRIATFIEKDMAILAAKLLNNLFEK